MKKTIILFNLIILSQLSLIKAQSIGFVETECGTVTNPSYYFENYSIGSHGHGYRLYHNGVIIKEEFDQLYGYVAEELRFINDTTGFFVAFRAGGSLSVYKIIGDSTIYIGVGKGGFLDLFIANAHSVFLASDAHSFFPNSYVSIFSYSDLRPYKYLIDDTSFTSNLTAYDTITGNPFCQDLSEINYKHYNGADTLDYKIMLYVIDSAYSIQETSKSEISFFPNPTTDYIFLQFKNYGKQSLLRIYDNIGILRKSINITNNNDPSIYIGDLENGFYVGELMKDELIYSFKFIKK